ncbi:MAG: hypothetical protein ACRDIB_14515 [Ardenticatenaceae bacterium]
MVETGLVLIDGPAAVGDVSGVALYYTLINPIENFMSSVGFGLTFLSDLAEGTNYLNLETGEAGIGQDTLVSFLGLALGYGLPLEGILDTIVNAPLVWYDAQSAAGNVQTVIELRWDAARGWYFVAYPWVNEASSQDE